MCTLITTENKEKEYIELPLRHTTNPIGCLILYIEKSIFDTLFLDEILATYLFTTFLDERFQQKTIYMSPHQLSKLNGKPNTFVVQSKEALIDHFNLIAPLSTAQQS